VSTPIRSQREVRHPAKFSPAILDAIDDLLGDTARILDPFAGTGRIHQLETPYREITGVELEPEWADMHPNTIVGDALALDFADATFDAIATSATYGNRMADHHNARDGSRRNTYRHSLGRELNPNNSGQFHWGEKYREFHVKAWAEAIRVLRPGGRFVLNIKDHYRLSQRQEVSAWHGFELIRQGLALTKAVRVKTPGLRHGANADRRVPHESVFLFMKTQADP
jgi:SAM-dependent methyltransferase